MSTSAHISVSLGHDTVLYVPVSMCSMFHEFLDSQFVPGFSLCSIFHSGLCPRFLDTESEWVDCVPCVPWLWMFSMFTSFTAFLGSKCVPCSLLLLGSLCSWALYVFYVHCIHCAHCVPCSLCSLCSMFTVFLGSDEFLCSECFMTACSERRLRGPWAVIRESWLVITRLHTILGFVCFVFINSIPS